MDFNLVELVKHMSVPVILTNIFMIVMGLFALYIIFERYATFKKATTENIGYVHALRTAASVLKHRYKFIYAALFKHDLRYPKSKG